MTSVESIRRNPFQSDLHLMHKSIPILPSTVASSLAPPSDPMVVSAPSMGPPSQGTDRNNRQSSQGTEADAPPPPPTTTTTTTTTNGSPGVAVGAAAAAQQPKVMQTAFIHKLYSMLEDTTIDHLISWSSPGDSFVMSPSGEFSKVLSSYFKHTNISSFVRQLNMYGFHKVSDVFHTGAPDSPLWEFKHGNGNFKRGDLIGLREIKRRASRHALIHRDSFPAAPKPSPVATQPGTSSEPMPDPMETRLSVLEHGMWDVQSRLSRSEDGSAYLNAKCQAFSEALLRCHQWNYELTNHIMTMVPDPDNPIHREVSNMQRDILRQLDMMRSYEENSPEQLPSARTTFFSGISNDAGVLSSPRLTAHDDSRRGSLASISSRVTSFRPPPPSHLSVSPRRYGSIGGGSTYPPSSTRASAALAPLPPPSMQYPAAISISDSGPPSNLPRRHTSADIRQHGWQPGIGQVPPTPSPFASDQSSGPWPSSPHRTPVAEQDLRNAFASYDIRGSRSGAGGSRHASPLPPDQVGPASAAPTTTASYAGSRDEAGWQLPGARYPFRSITESGPPTRRSSMASNVHSLLNPVETAERPEENEDGGGSAAKRKRL